MKDNTTTNCEACKGKGTIPVHDVNSRTYEDTCVHCAIDTETLAAQEASKGAKGVTV